MLSPTRWSPWFTVGIMKHPFALHLCFRKKKEQELNFPGRIRWISQANLDTHNGGGAAALLAVITRSCCNIPRAAKFRRGSVSVNSDEALNPYSFYPTLNPRP